ncbi:leishmanolysin domain-containing protein [Ditylenchus destructor]|nr:leishmanolysin domain-containing protein [Ditylenchus destructor]
MRNKEWQCHDVAKALLKHCCTRRIIDYWKHLIILIVILSVHSCTHIADAHHSCSYQVPDAEQVILNVPLALNDDEAPSNNYMERETSSQHKHKRRAHARFKRDSVLGREFQPLRIYLYYDPTSIEPLDIDKQLFINSSLLPQAVDFWTEALLVQPSNAPIRLSRKCKSNHYYLDAFDAHPSCVDQCKAVTTCGPGVTESDFLLYVSAVDSARCKNEDTIAYAAHCQQEQELDRPIAGHVNICPMSLSTHQHDQEILLSTVKHEILHALGFSAGLYAFFRHPDGQPRSKRNRYNRPLSFNRERGYYDADESTIVTIVRNDWWTAENKVPHPVHLMVTEKVKKEARNHFGCDELEGAELENQGGDGTALTHWEKRLFENEAMTGTHTQNPAYSRLTLALLEDSGWYKANYDVAEPLHWGRNLGCDFAMKSCGEWIKTRLERNLSVAPFCHDIKHDGRKSLATTRCTDQRDSLALCNLVPYKKALPIEYRNFDSLSGVRKEGVRYYGGSVELADFCPYNQEFEWKSVNSSDRRDSRCELPSNSPPSDSNSVMENYGSNSKCFDLSFSWVERKCGRVKTYSQFMAGCYEFVCMGGRVHVRVDDSRDWYTCYFTGQQIHIRRIVNGWLREGSIQCPPCEEICVDEYSWVNSTRKSDFSRDLSFGGDLDDLPLKQIISKGERQQCAPDSPEMLVDGVEVGDPILDEPCATMSIIISGIRFSLLIVSTVISTFAYGSLIRL